MSNNTRLFTIPPVKPRPFGTHSQTHDSIKAKVIRAISIETNELISETLAYRNGDAVVAQDHLLLQEAPSQSAPSAGRGRLWLRNDTPNRLIFTNDAGTDIAITPGLGEALEVDNDAGNNSILNINNMTFSDGISMGTVVTPASTSHSTDVAIGRGATASSTKSVVVGRSASSSLSETCVLGANSSIATLSPNSNDIGGVSVGFGNSSVGPGIVVGSNISNLSNEQDDGRANIFIGQGIATIRPEVCELDASGVYVGMELGGTPTFGQYFTLWNANNAGEYYFWMDNGGGTNDPGASGTGVEVNVVNAVAEVFTVQFSGQSLQTGAGNADYLIVRSGNDVTTYYVWFSDGTNSAPAVTTQILVPVDISGAPSDATIATNFAAAMNALGDFSAPVPGGTLATVALTTTGPTTDVDDTNAASITAVVTIPGTIVNTDAGVAQAIADAINTVGAHFSAVRTGNIVRVTNSAAGPSTDVANVNVPSLTVAVIQQGVVGGACVGIGNNVVPADNSVIIGSSAVSMGGGHQVCIGRAAEVASDGSVAIGDSSHCADDADYLGIGNGIAIGGNANVSNKLATAIGYASSSSGQAGVAMGAFAVASGGNSIAIGGGVSAGNAAEALQSNAIAIGQNSRANYAFSVALGNNVETRTTEEFASHGFRFIRGTVSTSTSTTTTILDFPTRSNEVLHVDGSITAYRRTNDTTYLASIEDFHFRNKAGTLTRAAGIGTLTEDTTEASYSTAIDVNGTFIRVTVTGISGHTVDWVCLLRVYATPNV